MNGAGRRRLWLAVVWGGAGLCASLPGQAARLGVGLDLTAGVALQYQSVGATVTVANGGEEAVIVGGSGAGIRFDIERRRDVPVAGSGAAAPRLPEHVIRPGESRTFHLDLGGRYDLSEVGQYRIRAVVELGSERFASDPKVMDVVPGILVVSRERPAPGRTGTIRTYSLRYWHLDLKPHLYLCVEDREKRVQYGVFDLGPYVRIRRPELRFGDGGAVSVAHQCAPACHVHTLFSSTEEGVALLRQDFRLPDGRPYPLDLVPK